VFVPSAFLPVVHDPCKDPRWRWLRAGYLLAHSRQPLRRDDEATRAAWLFRRELGRCHAEADGGRLARLFPAVAEAHSLYSAADSLKRWEVEARLLGGETDDTIAARCGLTPAGVGAYHHIYFEVRPHRAADSYIVNTVMGSKVHHGLAPDDHELLLKLFGYGLGGPGVDAYLDCLKDPPAVPASLGDLDPPALRKLGDKLRIQLVVLALTTPAAAAHPATWRRLAEQLAASRVPRRDPGQSGAGAPGAVCPAVDAVTLLPGGPAVGEGSGADEAVAGDLVREVSVRLTLCDELAAIRRGYGPIPA